MQHLKIFLSFIAMSLTAAANAQSSDSIKFNVNDNYESDFPPLSYNFDSLKKLVLFILDGKKLKGEKFSELEIDGNNLESLELIRDKKELAAMNCEQYNSVVILKSKK